MGWFSVTPCVQYYAVGDGVVEMVAAVVVGAANSGQAETQVRVAPNMLLLQMG